MDEGRKKRLIRSLATTTQTTPISSPTVTGKVEASTTSPYFDGRRQRFCRSPALNANKNTSGSIHETRRLGSNTRKRKSKIKTKAIATSRYFVNSPCSAWGSVQSLGSFLSQLTAVPPVEPTPAPLISAATATKKTTLEETAICHFHNCPVFREQWRLSSSKSEDVSRRTLGFERRLEQSVRHLCRHRCYMKAFAPARDWWSLRKAVVEAITDTTAQEQKAIPSVDRLLVGWTCVLIQQPHHAQNSTSSLSPPPRTGFLDPAGCLHTNVPDALKYLGLMHSVSHDKVEDRTKDGLDYDDDDNFWNIIRRPCYSPPRSLRNCECNPTHAASLTIPLSTDGFQDGSSPVASPPSETFDDPCNTIYRHHKKREINCFFSSLQSSSSQPTRASPFGLLEELFVDDPWKLLISTIFLNRTTRVQVDAVLCSFLQQWPTAEDVVSGIISMVETDTTGNESNDNSRRRNTYIHDYTDAHVDRMSRIIQPLGMWHRRARGILRFSREYLELIKRKRQSQKTDHHNRRENYDQSSYDRISRCHPFYQSEKRSENVAFNLSRNDILSLYNCGPYAADAYQIFIQHNYDIVATDHALRAYTEYQRGYLAAAMAHQNIRSTN